MLKNYLKIALRNIKNHKVYSFINIFGLSVGIACCILILLYVQYELSYDDYHDNADNIYRVSREWFNSDGKTSLHLGHVAPPGGPSLKEKYPEITEMVRFTNLGPLVKYKEKSFSESRFFGVDKDVFKMFSWKVLRGNPDTALERPFTMLLSESTAKKYFENEDPMGKTLTLVVQGRNFDVEVTGVFEDTPGNTHVHFDAMLSMASINQAFGERFMRTNWGSNNWSTYVTLPNNYDIANLESQMLQFMRDVMNNPMVNTRLHFWKLTDIHLHSNLDSEIEQNSDINNIYIFSAVAFFILLIACFNFMNLSTAKSANRAKEVGLRKVVGAYKNQLIAQFLSESILMAVVSLVFALIIVFLSLNQFNAFVNLPLTLDITGNIVLINSLIGIILFVGIISGSYPAFFLSAFKPVKVLKGERSVNSKSSIFRTVLVVAQFGISIMLIVSMGVVSDQLDFVRNKNLGFDKEQLITFGMTSNMRGKIESIKNQLKDHNNISEVTVSSRIPTGRLLDSKGGSIGSSSDSLSRITFRLADIKVDLDYFKTFKMEFAAGRDFSEEFATDKQNAFIINENAAKNLGFTTPVEAIGVPMRYGRKTGHIIGVVKDFHFESLRQPIVPIIFYYGALNFRRMTLKVSPRDMNSTIAYIENIWNNFNPGITFSFNFVDDNFERLYRSDEKLGQIFRVFSILAVVIACLGLFGLASFTAEKRTKEIGIRKVLGGSVSGIVKLLTMDFAYLIIIANIFAWPIAYYFMNMWLEGFAYRTSISIYTFLISGLAAMVIALLTVSYQSIKASIANPVKSLRYE